MSNPFDHLRREIEQKQKAQEHRKALEQQQRQLEDQVVKREKEAEEAYIQGIKTKIQSYIDEGKLDTLINDLKQAINSGVIKVNLDYWSLFKCQNREIYRRLSEWTQNYGHSFFEYICKNDEEWLEYIVSWDVLRRSFKFQKEFLRCFAV